MTKWYKTDLEKVRAEGKKILTVPREGLEGTKEVHEMNEVRQFFETLFNKSKGYIEIRTIAGKNVKRYFYHTNEIKQLTEQLSNSPEFKNVNTYFGVCPRDSLKGTEKNVKQINSLWVDIDVHNEAERVSKLNALKRFKIPPSIIVDSGHGYHAYWLFDHPYPINTETDRLNVRECLKGLIGALNADKARKDLSSILRVPGSDNVKDKKNPKKVKIISSNLDARYTMLDFEEFKVHEERGQRIAPDKINEWLRGGIKAGMRHRIALILTGHFIGEGENPETVKMLLRDWDNKNDPPYPPERKQELDRIVDDFARNKAEKKAREKEAEREREKPITAWELLEMNLPKEPYLIGKGLLPKQGYTLIVGKAKEGKTMLALNFALCLAEGIPVFMGKDDKRGLYPVSHKAKTLFLFRENAPQTIREIILKQSIGLSKLLNRKIQRQTFNLINFLRPKTVYLDIKEGQRELERIVKANPTDLVVIDPLSRFVAKDINKMEVVTGIANFMEDLWDKYGCAFLLLHHFRKLQAGGKPEEDPFERITGSAGLRNSMASGIVMERKSERRSRNIKKISFEFRNEESPEPMVVVRDPETLLFEPITEEEVLEGSSSVNKLVELMKKEFKNGVRYKDIADIGSKKFGVAKERIAELLKKGIEEGVISKEKGRTGKWFVI